MTNSSLIYLFVTTPKNKSLAASFSIKTDRARGFLDNMNVKEGWGWQCTKINQFLCVVYVEEVSCLLMAQVSAL